MQINYCPSAQSPREVDEGRERDGAPVLYSKPVLPIACFEIKPLIWNPSFDMFYAFKTVLQSLHFVPIFVDVFHFLFFLLVCLLVCLIMNLSLI